MNKITTCATFDNCTNCASSHSAAILTADEWDVEKYAQIPDWCPLVIDSLRSSYNSILHDSSYLRAISEINNSQSPDNAKSYSDHGLQHYLRVAEYGKHFLEQCNEHLPYEYCSTEKDIWLLKIAALLHDVGLCISDENHAENSADFARNYLSDNSYLQLEDIDKITHAIAHHSGGQDITTMLDAALYLGDKLDLTYERVLKDSPQDKLSPILQNLLKVKQVEYRFTLSAKSHKLTGAELHYTTKRGFQVESLCEWPKCITVPEWITKKFLGLKNFKFTVNSKKIDYHTIISKH